MKFATDVNYVTLPGKKKSKILETVSEFYSHLQFPKKKISISCSLCCFSTDSIITFNHKYKKNY